MKTQIEFCRIEDIDQVMAFISQFKRNDHILSVSKSFMDWQHKNIRGDGYNFVVAMQDEEVIGVLGFIPGSQFDDALIDQDSIWLAIWIVHPDFQRGALGISLLNYLAKNFPHRSIGTLGLNSKTLGLYQAFHYETGELKQYVLLDPNRDKFQVANVPPRKSTSAPPNNSSIKLVDLNTRELFNSTTRKMTALSHSHVLPAKSPTYFWKRYKEHPIYTYYVFGIMAESACKGLMAVREISVDQCKVMRIIDFVGDVEYLSLLHYELLRIISERKIEYIDLFVAGIDLDQIQESGFEPVDFNGELIVPDHFEPFKRQNHRVHFAYKSSDKESYMIFKGDGDQDRPSILNSHITGK